MGSRARAAAPRPAAGLRTTWAWIRGFHYKHGGPIRQRIGPRGSRKGGAGTAAVDYDRGTGYRPHAVHWIVSVSWIWSGVPTTERTPFSTTERVVPVAVVTLRVKAFERVRNARSVIAGVGSTMSIEPLSMTVCASPVNVQPVKSMRTESGTGSPSELVGGDGVRVGVQLADDVANAGAPGIGATANGMPVAASSVTPPASEAASVATTSATALASGCVRTGFWGDVKGEVEHAATNATVMVPAARRRTLQDMRRMRRSSDGSSTGQRFR